VFARDGYVAASMDEVAAVAGVSKQTVYKHFGSKEQLFLAVIQEAINGVLDEFFSLWPPPFPGSEDLQGDLLRLGWVSPALATMPASGAVSSYGHKRLTGISVNARLIRASCRIVSHRCSAVRPSHSGCTTQRTGRPGYELAKAPIAGMIRAGLAPIRLMSAQCTPRPWPFRCSRRRPIDGPGAATSTGSPAQRPSSKNARTHLMNPAALP
jgi:hypothetical protein